MSDIYDDLLNTIYELYDNDKNFYLYYKLNSKFVRRNLIYHMNPVPYDIKNVIHKFYVELAEEFENNDPKTA